VKKKAKKALIDAFFPKKHYDYFTLGFYNQNLLNLEFRAARI